MAVVVSTLKRLVPDAEIVPLGAKAAPGRGSPTSPSAAARALASAQSAPKAGPRPKAEAEPRQDPPADGLGPERAEALARGGGDGGVFEIERDGELTTADEGEASRVGNDRARVVLAGERGGGQGDAAGGLVGVAARGGLGARVGDVDRERAGDDRERGGDSDPHRGNVADRPRGL